MESPPLATYVSNKSKKRLLSGSSSSRMEPDVIEIMPPIARASSSPKSLKQKEVLHEIIDVDMHEDSADVIVIDEKGGTFDKGKETFPNYFLGPSSANFGSADGFQSSKSFSPGSHTSVNLDDFTSDLSFEDDEYSDMYYDDFVYDDNCTAMEAHFDNVDIPPGVEASIPWLQDPPQTEKKPAGASSSAMLSSPGQTEALYPSHVNNISLSRSKTVPAPVMVKPTSLSSTGFQSQKDAGSQSYGEPHSPFLLAKPGQSKKKLNATSSSTYAGFQTQGDAKNLKPGAKPSKWWLPDLSRSKKKHNTSSSTSHHIWDKQFKGVKFSPGSEPFSMGPYIPNSLPKQLSTSGLPSSSSHTQMDSLNIPPGVNPNPSKPFLEFSKFKKKSFALSESVYSNFFDPFYTVPSEEEALIPWVQDVAKLQNSTNATGSSTNPPGSISNGGENGVRDALKNYEHFKQFDTVQDQSDHHYKNEGYSLKQPSKSWAKKLQEEWRILEKNLPDTIFVRVYEARLDLLRAVIVGAEGTPYHDGLFFFDVSFPSGYPTAPPNVYYHSGGLRLNPNLYNSGKVCLSLLNTWSGGKNEKWIPGSSTMLQVLVSIQGLILNAKPYFNEPGFARMSGSAKGEKSSLQYNERTFILSLKTMLYTMRRPPKHFEDFVVGHFRKHAHDILVACKAYMDGAQVGCLVKGGVQDVDEGDKSCSKKFKESIAGYMKLLVKAFTQIGATDCEKFVR